jgi:hypothetical protein
MLTVGVDCDRVMQEVPPVVRPLFENKTKGLGLADPRDPGRIGSRAEDDEWSTEALGTRTYHVPELQGFGAKTGSIPQCDEWVELDEESLGAIRDDRGTGPQNDDAVTGRQERSAWLRGTAAYQNWEEAQRTAEQKG